MSPTCRSASRISLSNILEVIACSLEDARAAYAGGADRLEICSHLERQGMTPPVSLVADIIREVPLPVRVMIRDTSDNLDLLEAQVQTFLGLPLDGIIFGTLNAEKHLDFPGMDRVLRHLPPTWGWTLHRAFDWASGSVEEKLSAVAKHGRADHILTGDHWHLAPPRGVRFIAGGGLSFESLSKSFGSRVVSTCQEFHFGRDARTPQETTAPVDRARVRKLADLLHKIT